MRYAASAAMKTDSCAVTPTNRFINCRFTKKFSLVIVYHSMLSDLRAASPAIPALSM